MYREISFLVNMIIQNYLLNTRCIIFFTDNSCVLDFNLQIPIVSANPSRGNLSEKINYNLFNCESIVVCNLWPLETLKSFEYNIKSKENRLNSRRYLFLPNVSTASNFMNIFKMDELRFLTDILVINYSNWDQEQGCLNLFNTRSCEGILDLITHKYIGEAKQNEPVFLDKWFSANKTFLNNANLYPDKLKNMQKRSIKLSTFSYLPYTVVDPNTREADGSEMQMILEYTRRHNATLEFVVDEKSQWGKIYPNWTGIGVGGNLAMDKSDIGASAMFRWLDEYNHLDFAKSFIRTGVTTLMPAPRRADGWLTPVLSFTMQVWLLVLLSYFLSSGLFFIFDMCFSEKKLKTIKQHELAYYSCSLTIYAVYLQQSLASTSFINLTKSAKIILGTMFVFCLLVATSYSSGLASNLAVPRFVGSIDTTEQFAQSNIFWAGTHAGAWIASIEEDTEPLYQTIVKKFIETNVSEIKKLIHSRKSGIPIERLPSGHYAISKYMELRDVEVLRPMSQDLYHELTVVMLRKNSILLPSLDKLILRVYQSGIPLYWEAQVARKYLNMNVQNAIKHSSDTEHQKNLIKLSVSHILGALAVWFMGIIIGFLCFIYEVYYDNNIVKKDKFKINTTM